MAVQAPLPPAAAHAFVDDLGAPALAAGDRRHLEKVLRLRPGQAVTVSDGAGAWRLCSWAAGGSLEPDGPVVVEPAPEPAVTVAFALTKGERPEWVVQKLTEVGVDVIVGFRAARSVVRWADDKASGQVERWRRVAREAAMQSRRARLPDVRPVTTFDELVAGNGPAGGGDATLAAAGGGAPSLSRPVVLVGPEGGWDPAELACGLPTCGLGPTTLRAETATVAAGVILCGLRAGTIRGGGDAGRYNHVS